MGRSLSGSSISACVPDWKFMCRFFVRSQRSVKSRFQRNDEAHVTGSCDPERLSMSRSCIS